jgi:hypothetical protein
LKVNFNELSTYLFNYITKYRKEYLTFVSPPPKGAGYPKENISPFLNANEFEVFILDDGVVINLVQKEPDYQWYIAGGPALKIDYEPTRTPSYVTEILKKDNLIGQNIGIYRIVSKNELPLNVWNGKINFTKKEKIKNNDINVTLTLKEINSNLESFLTTLTFGAFCNILDIKLPNKESDIGFPHIIEKLGFFPSDLNNRRFLEYLEIYPHVDKEVWDTRITNILIKNHLRRDFSKTLSKGNPNNGGTISFGNDNRWIENYTNRLNNLKKAIEEFKNILVFHSNDKESTFHKLIEDYPILLDVYGDCESKPQLKYPKGEKSPIGKTYLEPDFIVKYSDQSYKLIELERASKGVATKQGQPRAEVSQAVFQIAEWVHFIKEHYNEIKTKYPGIHSKCKKSLIMSRTTQKSFKDSENINRYKELIINQYAIDEVLTYDDLFDRANKMFNILTGLSPNSI